MTRAHLPDPDDGSGEVCACCGAWIEYELDEDSCPECGHPPRRLPVE